MIHILCGERNQGKTTALKRLYREKNGDGFIAQKVFRDTQFYGYELMRLSTDESVLLSVKSQYFPVEEKPRYVQGEFSFFEEGFRFAEVIINDIIKRGISPVFIDEIGALELEGKGHCESFRKILTENRTIYISMRTGYLEQIVSFFGLKEYRVITLSALSR
ncbi:hypothetical protein JXQ70_05290 [bacterium]|nr:hypothetical protein [bacterium]